MESALRNLTERELNSLELIETFRFSPDEGFVRLAMHLRRMEKSAAAFKISFDRDDALRVLKRVGGETALRVRLSLKAAGEFMALTTPLAPNPPLWRFIVSTARLDPADPWLRHKTSRRARYDDARANLPAGVDEAVFCNIEGRLCEGAITNVFIERGGRLLTPERDAGLLPGVLREDLLADGRAEEADLTLDDLGADAVFLGNSLRGLIPARAA
ncbi:MAG: aminotransferase class IV [Tepidamorphaceae bacterium]